MQRSTIYRNAMGPLALLLYSTFAYPAPPFYTATRILGPHDKEVQATAINNHGDVVGSFGVLFYVESIGGGNIPAYTDTRAFLFSKGIRTDLDMSAAHGLNDSGQVVGENIHGRAVTLDEESVREIHPATAWRSAALAINASGAIVGSASFQQGAGGFLFEGGRHTTLPSLSAGGYTIPYAINTAGQIVGYSITPSGGTRAVMVSSGGIADLGTYDLPDERLPLDSTATALNNRGEAVGYGQYPRTTLLYTSGKVVPIGSLGNYRTEVNNGSGAYGINDANQIVGESESPAGNRAYLHVDGQTTDLNALVVSGLAGAVLTSAVAINASGQIAANACTSEGRCAAFRLDPLTPAKARGIEYYNAGFDHYFLTIDADEINKLDNGMFVGWTRTGEGMDFDASPLPGTSPVCRFFSASFAPKSSHFYTPDTGECSTVKADPAWQFEGEVFHVALPDAVVGCTSGKRAVYRLYNKGSGGAPNHRYTTNPVVREAMIAKGWAPEGSGSLGAAMCV